MDKNQMAKERARLQAVLDVYNSGNATAWDEDRKSELNLETPDDRRDGLKQRIANLDRKIADDGIHA